MSRKISELPQYIGTPQPTGDIPISIGGVTYKIDPSKIIELPTNQNELITITLNEYSGTEILNFNNAVDFGGFINYVIKDNLNNVRSGTIKFCGASSIAKFKELITQSIGNSSDYTFYMSANAPIYALYVLNASERKAEIRFYKQLN
jgi:hypothetical protein